MSKRFLTIALTISVAINLTAISTFTYYWWKARSFKRYITSSHVSERYGWRRSPLRRKLNLTEDQIEVINKQHEERKARMIPLMEELSEKRTELMTSLRDSEINEARADTLQRQIATLQFKADSQIFENLCQIKDILTPEQQEQFFTLFEKRQLYQKRMYRPPSEEHFKLRTNNRREQEHEDHEGR